ncbi:MAG: alpha/beta hydrolase [Moraxellaceae bacterium]|jgi:pimeloyl-ACP methyl ester carboxylesterase|nr:alpha/beta hydrolase [Moraxellaceae bacterium]
MRQLIAACALGASLVFSLPVIAADKSVFEDISLGQEAIAGLTRHESTIDGARIFYLDNDRKDAKRTILMVHGFGDSGLSWTQFARLFRDNDYRIVIPDLPGFGRSDKTPGRDYSYEAQAKRLFALMQSIGVPKFHVVGNSMGGGVAAELAVQQPVAIQSLTLMDAAGIHYRPTELDRTLLSGRNILVMKKPADFDAMITFASAQRPAMPRPVLDYLSERAVQDSALHERIFQDVLFEDINFLLPKLDAIKAPTLVLWGEKDRVLHPDNAKVFSKYIKGSQVVILPGVGHIPMAEVPYESAAEVVKFIGALP